jgi:large subunit ribosomal protein L18
MKKKLDKRQRRADRIRKKIAGSPDRPRLCVRRSLSHIYAQIVDDITGNSFVQTGSTSKEIESKITEKGKATKTEVAKLVGELVAEKAKEKGIEKVVFDRKGYAYHGRVKALADAARKKGLQF